MLNVFILLPKVNTLIICGDYFVKNKTLQIKASTLTIGEALFDLMEMFAKNVFSYKTGGVRRYAEATQILETFTSIKENMSYREMTIN